MHERMRELLIQGAIIVLAGLWIYSPVYHGDWLWDDDVLLTQNVTVQSGSLAGLVKLWLSPDGIDYFPLSYTLLWMQWPFFGLQSTGYHVTSILLHVTSSLLVWLLLTRMRIPGAWISALVFTIHPACVESVAWVSETKNTLSLVLFLTSCIFWIAQDEREAGPPRERLYLASLALFLLTMFAKTSVVAMPVLTLLYAWWKRGRVTTLDAVRAAPLFLISLVLGLVTIHYQHGRAIGVEQLPVGGLDSRIAIAGMAILFYLTTIVWPLHLLPIYPRWEVDPPTIWQFLPWSVLGIGGWWLWTNRRADWARNTIFALGFFLLMIAPVLGFVDISFMRITWVADHFLYLPMIGPLALIVATLTSWVQRRGERERTLVTIMAGGLLVMLALNAFFYAVSWVDEEHLWEYTLAANHGAWQAHNRLGAKKLANGDLEGAYYHFRNSSRLRPDLGETKNNLAITLMRKGNLDEAIKTYEEALRAAPNLLQIRVNLAEAYGQVGRFAEARDLYETLLPADPANAMMRNNYAITLFKTGAKEQAAEEFRLALKLKPDLKAAQQGLDAVLKDLQLVTEEKD